VLQKQLWLEMDSDIILNKPDLNTCQCRGMVYRLFMSIPGIRRICSTIFPIMYHTRSISSNFRVLTARSPIYTAIIIVLRYRVGQKIAQFFVYLITSPNINRFSKFVHCQNQETICNKTVTTDPTTLQMCRYTTS